MGQQIKNLKRRSLDDNLKEDTEDDSNSLESIVGNLEDYPKFTRNISLKQLSENKSTNSLFHDMAVGKPMSNKPGYDTDQPRYSDNTDQKWLKFDGLQTH